MLVFIDFTYSNYLTYEITPTVIKLQYFFELIIPGRHVIPILNAAQPGR